MQVRIARHTSRLQEVVRFYRDGLGLPELGGFEGHEGYAGVFLGLPGTEAHLEFTTGGEHGPPGPHPESLLVLYLGGPEAVAEICKRAGAEPVEAANPYWRRHAVTLLDPDGFPVVLVPDTWS
jgi:catechol 2,3-dioxygenase-like lactoylglutathione lyase family enzyme